MRLLHERHEDPDWGLVARGEIPSAWLSARLGEPGSAVETERLGGRSGAGRFLDRLCNLPASRPLRSAPAAPLLRQLYCRKADASEVSSGVENGTSPLGWSSPDPRPSQSFRMSP